MVILANSDNKSSKKKQQIGQQLLRSMKEEFDVEPDRMVLNWYLRVCASASSGSYAERQESLRSAFEVFESLRNSKWRADSNSYITMFHACHNLLNEEDPEGCCTRISGVFSQCAEDGYVNRKVLMFLKRFVSAETYQELTLLNVEADPTVDSIPASWHRNVRNWSKNR